MAKSGHTCSLQAGCARTWAGDARAALLLRLVAAAAILCSTAASDLNGMIGMKFEGIAEKQAEYMQSYGFENETCSDILEDPFALDATQFLDSFIDIIGTDTIRAMSIRNMRTVGVIKQQSQATRLATHTPRSSRGMPKPKVEPGTGKLATCAIIGSSGHLRATSYGANIDMFDLVARGNQAPTKGYEEFVGSKTTMRFLNDALTKRYRQSVNGAIMSAIKSCVLKKRSWKKSVSLMSARGRKVVDAKKPLSRPQPIKLTLKPPPKTGGSRALLEEEDGGRVDGTFRGMNLSARLSATSNRLGAEELSKRLTLAFRERKGPLSAPWSALKGYLASLTTTENKSKARKMEVLQLASSCERSLMEEVAKAGKITPDSVRYDSWMFPLEQGVILTHISEFKQSNLPEDHNRLVGHLRLHRPDVKSAMVNYPVSFLAEDIIKKWADRLVCKGVLPEAGGTRPTTGFTMLLSLLPVCGKVVMYGFGPPSGNPPNGTDYHFFQGMLNRNWQTTSANVHNFKAEYLFIKSLARKGRLTICNNANSDECGLNDENLDAAEAAEEALGDAVKASEERRGTVSPSLQHTANEQAIEQEAKHEAEGLSKAASMTFVDPNQVFETLPEEIDRVPTEADNEEDIDGYYEDDKPKSPNDVSLGMEVEDL